MFDTKKIILGSAQWGSHYGITNNYGQTPLNEIGKILDFAKRNGTTFIDTANLYGEAEQNLGKFDLKDFNIITKTIQFNNSVIKDFQIDRLNFEFHSSLNKLGLKNIYGLLIHKATDILKEDSKLIINKLISFKKDNLVKKIGISLYDFSLLDEILNIFTPDIIQIPFNIFDQRLLEGDILKKIKNKNIEIHARSIFLQGILLSEINSLPTYFSEWIDLLQSWSNICNENNLSKLEAALSFVIGRNEVDFVVIGFENLIQLEECFHFNKFKKIDFRHSDINDLNLVDPRKWNNGRG